MSSLVEGADVVPALPPAAGGSSSFIRRHWHYPFIHDGTAAFLGELALTCRRAQRDGTLRRLKSCVNCEWTIYDASKNQSGRWCSMNVCGGRHNARVYRQRQHR